MNYINRLEMLMDRLVELDPFDLCEENLFPNPIEDEIYEALHKYESDLQKIAEDYDLTNEDINKSVISVNTTINKLSQSQKKERI